MCCSNQAGAWQVVFPSLTSWDLPIICEGLGQVGGHHQEGSPSRGSHLSPRSMSLCLRISGFPGFFSFLED